jgi:hypothetical protein
MQAREFRRPIMGSRLSMSTDASSIDMPRPDPVNTPAELVAAMRALHGWAKLTYRQLERRAQLAGDRLPHSTIASALSRNAIPRENTLASFVRACGGDRNAVEVWLAARRRITAADKAVGNLAYAVEAWLTGRVRPSALDTSETPIITRNFADGRLAQTIAESKGERWIGVHRRAAKRRMLPWRRLARKLREPSARN